MKRSSTIGGGVERTIRARAAHRVVAQAAAVETLETRRLLSTFIPALSVNDLVFDPTRDLLYMPTSGSGVLRYDAAAQASLPALNIAGTLRAGDITPDGSSLYLTTGDNNIIRKVNLATGSYINLGYSGYAPVDIGMAANGKALFTTTYPGSGWVPLFQIDTATDTITTRGDYPGGSMSQDGRIGRSADGATLFITESNNSSGPMKVYQAGSDTFTQSGSAGWSLTGVRPAVSRDGTLGSFFATSGGVSGLTVRDLFASGLPEAQRIRNGSGGAMFSPTDDVLYVGMAAAFANGPQFIAAYDTSTWQVLSVIPADGTLGGSSAATAISDDGRYLFFHTTTGVRVYDTTTDSLPSPFQLAGDGTLTINGSDGNDVIEFYADTTTLHAVINGVWQGVPLASLTSVTVNGNGGDDSLKISQSPDVPMEWHGGGGENTLVFYGSDFDDTLTLGPSALSGSLGPLLAGGATRAASLAITDTLKVTLFSQNGNDTLSATGAPAGASWLVEGGNGDDSFTRGAAAGRIDLSGGGSGTDSFVANGTAGADYVFVHGWASSPPQVSYKFNGVESTALFMDSIRFNLLDGDDRGLVGVDYTYPPTTIDGGAGNDLFGQRSTASGGFAVSRPVTYLGGEGDDAFWVADRRIFTIDGGPGNDGMIADPEDIVTNVENNGTATISGFAFNDADRDGVRDAGETPLEAAIISIDDNGDGIYQTGEWRSDSTSTGSYSFGPLPAGTYAVRAMTPPRQQHLRLTNAGHDITVGWSGAVTDQNFGFSPPIYPATEGMPDSAFGEWGNAVSDYNNTSDTPYAFGLQSDGKIVVAGSNSPLSSSNGPIAVRRFNADGTPDNTFAGGANGGWALWTFPGRSNSWPTSMVVLPDDRLLLAGSDGGTPGLSRLTANGLLDTTFSGDGMVVVSSINGLFGHLARLPDGRFYVTGWAYNINSSPVNATFIMRFLADGTPDTSFGPNGLRLLPVATNRLVSTSSVYLDLRVQVDAEGRAIIVLPTRQSTASSTPRQATILRLNLDGTPDTTFGTGGEINLRTPGNGSITPQDFEIMPDGRMLISGYSGVDEGVFVARLLPNGSLDQTFGSAGFHSRTFAPAPPGGLKEGSGGASMAVTKDGRFVLATQSSDKGLKFVRLTADGQGDPTFAADSETPGAMEVWIHPRTSNGVGGGSPRGLLLQPDGKPLALAMVYDKGWEFALVRLLGADPHAGKPTARLSASRVTPTEGDAVNVSFTDIHATPGASGDFRYSCDFNNDGTFEIMDSTDPTAAVPALYIDGPRILAIRGRIRDIGSSPASENDYVTYLVISNVAPVASVRTYTSSVNEGSTGARIKLSGLEDPSPADIASGLLFSYDFDGDGKWDIVDSPSNEVLIPESYYADGPLTLAMRARVADKDGGATEYAMTMQVQNDPPTALAGSDRSATAGTPLTLSGSASDSSPLDTISAQWVVRDAAEQIVAQGSGLTFEFLPPTAGVYTAELIATDDDGGEGRDTLLITSDAPTFLSAAPQASWRFAKVGGELKLAVLGGEVTLSADAGAAHPGLNVDVEGGLLTLAADQRLGTLRLLGEAARVELIAGADQLLRLTSLSIAAGAMLDLADNDLLLDYSSVSPVGIWTGDAYDGVTGMIQSGRIVSSESPGTLNGLAVAEARDALSITGTQTGSFAGQVVDSTSLLVKFTWGGDANLDGKVNIDDYGRIDGNVSQSGSVWGYFNGDFNLDGKINIDDYGIIDGNVNAQDGVL